MSIIFPDKSRKILQNKIIDGGAADNEHKVIVPANTTTNLSAIDRSPGAIYYDTTANGLVFDNGSSLVSVAAAGSAVSSFNGRIGAVVPQTGDYTKTNVGLANVDNTSDANKPVSTAQNTAINTRVADTGDSMTGALNITMTGSGQLNTLTLNSNANTAMIIKNSGAGTNGLLIGNSGGASVDYQILNQDTNGRLIISSEFIRILPGNDPTSANYVLSALNNDGDAVWVDPATLAATVRLDNLTSPTAINQDFIFDTGGNVLIQTKDDATNQTNRIQLKSGDGTGFQSGRVTIQSGASDVATGNLFLQSPAPSASDANSGNITIRTGDVSGGATPGTIVIQAGQNENGNAGNISLAVSAPSGIGDMPHISLYTGQVITEGQIFTALDSNGMAEWQNLMAAAPVSASATGRAGQIAYDSGFFYVCIATDTWKRVAIASW